MYYVYILTCSNQNVLYTGVTNNIKRRFLEHKKGNIQGFTKKYNVNKLIYFETFSSPYEAILREKQIKNWSRRKKNLLIKSKNPEWKDTSEEVFRYL